MSKKRLTKKQMERKIRDAKIKAVYESLPEGTTLQQLANMFSTKEKPCSVSSVWYAVNGRKKPAQVSSILRIG